VLNILGFWGVMMVILQVVSNICEGLYFLHHREQSTTLQSFKTSVITHS